MPASGQAPVTIAPDGNGFVVTTPIYTARVLEDGNLHSLVVKGVEMLDDKVGDSAGAYLSVNGPVKFAKVEMVDPTTLKATTQDAEITYKLAPDYIALEVLQSLKPSAPLFVILSKAFERANNMSGPGSVKGIATGWWGTVRFITGVGPVLHVDGLSNTWGPWPDAADGRQVCQADALQGQPRSLVLVVGEGAWPEDLVSLHMSCSRPDFLFFRGEQPSVAVEVVNDGALFEVMLTCTLAALDGKALSAQAVPVTVQPNASAKASFELAKANQPGFYDVTADFRQGKFLVRRETITVGFAPDELRPPLYRQPDFHDFWKATLDEARAMPLDPQLTTVPERSDEQVTVYKLNLAGLNASRWYAWYCVPNAPGRHPAVLVLPAYGDGPVGAPVAWARRGAAALALQGREHDVDLPQYEGKPYMLEGIDARETYVYRRIYAACVRCVDFLCDRPEVDPEKIAVTGASQGGGLALATAALDPRVKLCMPDVPFLSDYPETIWRAGYPYKEIADYLAANPDQGERLLGVLSYFDAMNLAPDINCPVLMSVGLRDRTCPPQTVYAVLNQIPSRKEMRVYPFMGHAEPPEQQPIKEQRLTELAGG